MDELTDEELIARFRSAGALQASDPHLNELFRRYCHKVALWTLRFTGDRESATDLAQEIFLTVHQRLDSFRGESKFSTWLYTITRNHCLNAVQSAESRRRKVTEPLDPEFAGLAQASPYEGIELAQLTSLMRSWINDVLDETEKKVVALHFGQEMPLEAVTRVLGLRNVSGAKAYMVSARRKLQRAAGLWKAQAVSRGDSSYGNRT